MSYIQCDLSEKEYKGNGTQKQFTFPFTYIDASDVYVDLFDVDSLLWSPASAPYTWTLVNAQTVEFATAPPVPGKDIPNIRIYRKTDITNMLAQFNPGSAIRAVDLNNDFKQLQYAAQEGQCQGADHVNPEQTYTAAADKGTLTLQPGGDTTDLPLATTALAGLLAPADKTVIDNVAGGSSNPVATYTPAADSGTLTLQPGGDTTTIPAVTATEAGLMTAADKTSLTNLENGTATNPTAAYTALSNGGTLTLQPGGDTTAIPLATGTLAGLLDPNDKTLIDNLVSGDAGVQQVNAGDGITVTGEVGSPVVSVAFGTTPAAYNPTTVMPYDIDSLDPLP